MHSEPRKLHRRKGCSIVPQAESIWTEWFIECSWVERLFFGWGLFFLIAFDCVLGIQCFNQCEKTRKFASGLMFLSSDARRWRVEREWSDREWWTNTFANMNYDFHSVFKATSWARKKNASFRFTFWPDQHWLDGKSQMNRSDSGHGNKLKNRTHTQTHVALPFSANRLSYVYFCHVVFVRTPKFYIITMYVYNI